jgi:DNA-binding CsgD family transcriptional regulator
VTSCAQLHWSHCERCGETTLHSNRGCTSAECARLAAAPAATVTIVRQAEPVYVERGARKDMALTQSELAVLELLARGFDCVGIAQRMRTSLAAVRCRRQRIAVKFGVHLAIGRHLAPENDRLLVATACERGILAIPKSPATSPAGDSLPTRARDASALSLGAA